MHDTPPSPPVVTEEIRVVDAQGHPRIVLSAKDGKATIVLMDGSGNAGATLALDAANHPSVTLINPHTGWPSAALEIDDKGAHVKFDRPGGASSYLFLNNAGGSGTVLVDASGKRRLDVTVSADGESKIERYGDNGQPLATP